VSARENAFSLFYLLSKPGSIGEKCIRDSLASGKWFPDEYEQTLREDRLNHDPPDMVCSHRLHDWGEGDYEGWAREFVASSGPAKEAQRQAVREAKDEGKRLLDELVDSVEMPQGAKPKRCPAVGHHHEAARR
jgi:hypothetical protein